MADVVLVTGSTGLIGNALSDRLGKRFEVLRTARSPNPLATIPLDVSDPNSIKTALAAIKRDHGSRLAAVVHLAAYYDFSGQPSPLYERVTVQGTHHLLQALQAFEVEQFLFASTMLVHAPSRFGHRIREDSPLAPAWAYPESKLETEAVIKAAHGRIPAVVLRVAGVYDDWCHSIPLAQQIRRIYDRDVTGHLFPGDMHHGQSFVHLDDTVAAIAAAIDQRGRLPEETTLLIGENETVSYGQLQDQIGHLIHGREWVTYEIPKTVAKVGAWLQDVMPLGPEPFVRPWMVDLADDAYCVDTSLATETLGWRPEHALASTLPVMIRHLLDEPERWFRENDLDLPKVPREKPHDVAARAG